MSRDYSSLPPVLQYQIYGYFEKATAPKGFVKAVLCNDLLDTLASARSFKEADSIVTWLCKNAKDTEFGSFEKVLAWCENKPEHCIGQIVM